MGKNVSRTNEKNQNVSVGDQNISDINAIEIPSELSILPVDNVVIFPYMIAPLTVVDDRNKQLVTNSLMSDRLVATVTRKVKPEGATSFEHLYEIGTVSTILKMLRMPDGSIRILIHGIRRIKITASINESSFLKAKTEFVPEVMIKDDETRAMVRNANDLLNRIIKVSSVPEDLGVAAINVSDPGRFADLLASNLTFKLAEQQEILEMGDVKERLRAILVLLQREADMLELGSKIQSQVKTKIDKRQREYMLREQLAAIQKELGEGEGTSVEMNRIREEIEKAKLPKHAKEVAQKELKRLETIPPAAAEYTVSRSYLDWIVSLPWSKSTRDNLNIKKAAKILDEDHYDLEKIKERILEFLSVMKLKKNMKGPILCFVGPPGVGKTSLGRSIARALKRKFFRSSLGGMRDEAEIRGHRRTYIGALPGRIIKALRTCGSNNPLIMLDEIDKLGADFRGDPASALLEVLDPEQNNAFVDNYLDIPFDLSKVMFITTANILDTIPPALRDRMEIIRLSGYTLHEKVSIARKYLLPKQIESNGISDKDIEMSDEALSKIIENYTLEAGLRNIERSIGTICRKVARKVAEGDSGKVSIDAKNVQQYLGPPKFFSEVAKRTQIPGVATGLAWTQVGGEILFIEAAQTSGSGELLLTGQLGDVMKESAQAALSFLRSESDRIGISPKAFDNKNIHIHVPAGAIPKDGPSAGITMCTAMASLLRNEPIKPLLAMTGEITLKGNILPIGGVKEKVLAAASAGIKTIVMPARNKKDMEEVPEEIRKKIKFKFYDTMVDVIDFVFDNHEKKAAKTPTKKRKKKGV